MTLRRVACFAAGALMGPVWSSLWFGGRWTTGVVMVLAALSLAYIVMAIVDDRTPCEVTG